MIVFIFIANFTNWSLGAVIRFTLFSVNTYDFLGFTPIFIGRKAGTCWSSRTLTSEERSFQVLILLIITAFFDNTHMTFKNNDITFGCITQVNFRESRRLWQLRCSTIFVLIPSRFERLMDQVGTINLVVTFTLMLIGFGQCLLSKWHFLLASII